VRGRTRWIVWIEERLDRPLAEELPGDGGGDLVAGHVGELRVEQQCRIRAALADEIAVEPLARDPLQLAEEVELRMDLELAAVKAALPALSRLPETAFLAVNVSPETAVASRLLSALSSTPLDRIVIEITEHAPVHDYEALNTTMRRMRGRGIRLAVDDAGSGFASLRHILQLAPDIIKIDNALTRNVYKDPARRALAAGLISFAAELGATIVAEGIQSRHELDALRDLGVRYGQGFYLGHPGPIAEVMTIGDLTR